MKRTHSSIVAVGVLITSQVCADVGDGWGHYGGSEKGLQYSSADQINLTNVANLKIAWQYRTGELGEGSRSGYSFQANPILVRGTLYVSTGSGIIMAIDPVEGTERWRYDPKLDRTRGTSETANRGVSSWVDATRSEGDACFHRIYIGILDSRLISVDGASGKPCTDFGEHGEIDLSREVRLLAGDSLDYQVTSPPVIIGDTIVSGSAIGDNRAVEVELGIVRGFDARTGELRWRFDPIPRDVTDPLYASWNPNEADINGAANAWAPLAADSKLGLVYVPTGSVSPDFYGGEREGDNRYANSIVALRAEDGAVVWHQQLVHHDVWDYDLPAQPTLADLLRDGETIPAVIQATKMGMLFTFNRVTGEPIFDIVERPVPQGGVPGEHLSKTQPFPVAPPPLMSHKPMTGDDAYGFVLFDKWDCADQFEELRSDGIYTPPSLEGSVQMPSYGGGMNWGGLAFDPHKQIVVVNTMEMPAVVQLIRRDEFDSMRRSGEYPESQFSHQSGTPYAMRRQMILSPLGAPCSAPPWGRLTAVDMTKGEILWQVPFGTIEDMVPDFVPNLELGVPGLGGPIITAGGVAFIGAAMDDYIRAFNVATGEEVWKFRLPAGGQATPMTYVIDGRQYVVIVAGGHNKIGTTLGDYVIAFSL